MTMRTLDLGGSAYKIVDLPRIAAAWRGLPRLPYCLRILLENVARHVGRNGVDEDTVASVASWHRNITRPVEVPFHPARVLMQDFTGMPALVDLAALRDAVAERGNDPGRVNPTIPVDIVIDHSLIVDEAGHPGALDLNVAAEFRRNGERYRLAKWAEQAFDNLRVVPPGKGIVHQVNIEYLAEVVTVRGEHAFADTMVGADSHSTMVNGIGVLGWGVGGIEAEAAMLGMPLVLPLKRVVGIRLVGRRRPGVTATDLVLTVTEALRKFGVVDCLVEFFGPALDEMPVADRVTVANMAPDYGATCALFPIDISTLRYLAMTGRSAEHVALIEAYARAQGLWYDKAAGEAEYSDVLELRLDDVEPCGAGPRRPQDRVPLARIPESFAGSMKLPAPRLQADALGDGAVVIAAITSCTNTSNPALMIAAGLLARNAVSRGLRARPWVKTSFTPGSRVVGAYLDQSGLQASLDALGFHVAGYGCATCGGFSGRLAERVETAIRERGLATAAVLSGNRNFEARIHPLARANYLVSPPLVVAYALAGTIGLDLTSDPVAEDASGSAVYLRDLWPSDEEVETLLDRIVSPDLFREQYGDLRSGTPDWRALAAPAGKFFQWEETSSYVKRPPFFEDRVNMGWGADISAARILLVLGDDITTDHISPVGAISARSSAGAYLTSRGVLETDFNAYGARRTNHEVMLRGTFGNPRLRNALIPGGEGAVTLHHDSGEILPIYDAAMRYAGQGTPLVVIAGASYGTGSARDWAAKGTRLLGIRCVIAGSFERIHRANLAAFGVLPLEFMPGEDIASLLLDGTETIEVEGISDLARPNAVVSVSFLRTDGTRGSFDTVCRLDSAQEIACWRSGGVLPHILGKLGCGAEPAKGAAGPAAGGAW